MSSRVGSGPAEVVGLIDPDLRRLQGFPETDSGDGQFVGAFRAVLLQVDRLPGAAGAGSTTCSNEHLPIRRRTRRLFERAPLSLTWAFVRRGPFRPDCSRNDLGLNRLVHQRVDNHVGVEGSVLDYGLSPAGQDELWRRWCAGESLSSMSRSLEIPLQHVRRFLAQTGGVRRPPRALQNRHLTLTEREEISRGLAMGCSCTDSLRSPCIPEQ